MLALLTCHYNPAGYCRPILNARTFYNALGSLREHVFCVQATFPDKPKVDLTGICCHSERTATKHNLMWQKERLLREAMNLVPPCYDKIAWLDADLLFNNLFWYEQTEELLDIYPVCQLMEAVSDTSESGTLLRESRTFGWRMQHAFHDTKNWYRPGGAWAARREIAEECLADEHILGGCDSLMAFAWSGEVFRYKRAIKYCPEWASQYQIWADRQNELVRGRIGCVNGTVTHLWHGNRGDRQYVQRESILSDYKFNPFLDIRVGTQGLWEWASDKPEMHEAVRNYFSGRKEDGDMEDFLKVDPYEEFYAA